MVDEDKPLKRQSKSSKLILGNTKADFTGETVIIPFKENFNILLRRRSTPISDQLERYYALKKALQNNKEEMVQMADVQKALEIIQVIREERGKVYGDSWRKRGLTGNAAQIQEKAIRLETLAMSGKLKDSAALDTAVDLANYALFFVELYLEQYEEYWKNNCEDCAQLPYKGDKVFCQKHQVKK